MSNEPDAAAPFCMINPGAGKGAFTAFLLRDGIFWAAKVEPKSVKKAGGWLDEWNANALSFRLGCIQEITGTVDGKNMSLVCTDDGGKRHDIRLNLASRADRDLMRRRLLAQLGDWPEKEAFESRGATIAKGVLGFLGCLFIAWVIAGLSGGSIHLPGGWGLAVAYVHGVKSSFLAALAVSFSKAIGPVWGLVLSAVFVLLGTISLIASIFIEGEKLFEYKRPTKAA